MVGAQEVRWSSWINRLGDGAGVWGPLKALRDFRASPNPPRAESLEIRTATVRAPRILLTPAVFDFDWARTISKKTTLRFARFLPEGPLPPVREVLLANSCLKIVFAASKVKRALSALHQVSNCIANVAGLDGSIDVDLDSSPYTRTRYVVARL
jgi:hypothetical protein